MSLPSAMPAPKGLLPLLFLGVLMGALDIAIVGPALPELQRQFGVDERALAWVFSAYVLANISGAPLLGKLSDTFGRRNLYAACLLLFGLGSLLVVVAPDFQGMILGRAFQGFGAGGIFPVASATIADLIVPERRGRALGLIGAVFGLAFLVGPLLGTLLLPFGWRWLFLLNLPLAFALPLAAMRIIPNQPTRARGPFDTAGALSLSPGLLLIAMGLTRIDTKQVLTSLTSPLTAALFVAGLALLAFFVWHERTASNPILRLQSFQNRNLAIGAFLAFGAGVTEAMFVFIPPFLVGALALPSAQASAWLAPPVLALTVGAPTAGRLLDRLGPRQVLLMGTGTLSAGLFALGIPTPTLTSYVMASLLIGLGIAALVGAPVRYLVLSEARVDERASLQSAISLTTSMGQLLGGVFIGAAAASGANGTAGYRLAFVCAGVFTLGLMLAAWALRASHSDNANPNEKPGDEQLNLSPGQ